MSATHKYHAKATTVDGIRFASMKEAKRYGELKLLEKAGEIREIELQPEFVLLACLGGDCAKATPIGTYRGDFKYEERTIWLPRTEHETESWRFVVEDVKGFKTPLYKWKKKHVEAQYGIAIREI